MRKLLILSSIFFLGCGQSKEEQNRKLTEKLDEMKQCLKYADQDQCEDKVGIKVFKDGQTGQHMFKDAESGNFVLPVQGQNGQPQFQTFQSYPPPQVINNYVPVQSHSNSDFLFGTMLGMTMAHSLGGGSYYAPPSYYRGHSSVNNTTIINNNNRSYDSKRMNDWETKRNERQAQRLEQREKAVKLREAKQERREKTEQRRLARNEQTTKSSGINLSKNSESSSRRVSSRETSRPRESSSRRSSSSSSRSSSRRR